MSYAVTWSESGGPVFAGSLEVSAAGIRLIGTTPSAGTAHESVHCNEVAEVQMERRPGSRLGGRPTLLIDRRDGTQLRISSLSGAGLLNEIAGRVSKTIGRA